MSTYQIRITEPAEAEIDAAYQYLFARSQPAADRFRDEIAQSIRSLMQFPERCVLAPENGAFDRDVRQLIYRHGRTAYRILSMTEADDDLPAFVLILRVRHGAQERLV